MTDFARLLTAMITPMEPDGAVAWDRARQLARDLVAAGSDGLVVGGTTGEAPALCDAERLRLFGEVRDAVGPAVPVVAGTSDNDHRRSIELTREAERVGVDGVLLTVPAYSRPPQEGLVLHFRALAAATTLPCMLYNVPSRTACNMEAATTLQLAGIDNVVGIKEASGDLRQIARILAGAPDGFRLWSGNDDDTFAVLCLGGHGVVSVASHLVGGAIRRLIDDVVAGRLPAARAAHLRLLPLFQALFWVTSPVPVKHALRLAGFDAGPTRLPLAAPDPDFVERFEPVLTAALAHGDARFPGTRPLENP